MGKKKRITLSFDAKVVQQLRWRAARRHRTMSSYVREALERDFRHDDEYEKAYQSWLKVHRETLPITGPIERITREKLHDRTKTR